MTLSRFFVCGVGLGKRDAAFESGPVPVMKG